MFQGNRAEARELNATLRFDPRQIDAVVVSHAHLDHIGRLPLLVAHQYDKPIFATPALSQGRLLIRTPRHLWCIGATH